MEAEHLLGRERISVQMGRRKMGIIKAGWAHHPEESPKESIGLEIHYGELRFLSGKLEEWEGSSERGQAFPMTG